jgi:serine protease Do
MRQVSRSLAATLASVLLLSACMSGASSDPEGSGLSAAPVTLEQSPRQAASSSVAKMIRRVLPSVVNVRVRGFDQFGGSREGQGSGVVIDSRGYILTNAHVIGGAVDVTVVLNDGTELDGTVVGAATERDLAVVKVDAADLTPIEIGHSSPPDLNLGDAVVAIGFPLGLGGPTVTKGIVSGEDRNINVGGGTSGVNRLEGVLQTDAAINPGNSGGPLVNMAGQLVGINSAGASASVAENIGFAIAIDTALPVVREILAKPEEKRAWMGVLIAPVTPLVAGQLGLPSDTRGVYVDATIPGGPAAKAGIRSGEVIVRVGDADIASPADLTSALADLVPGDTVEVELVSRDGTRTVDLQVAARPPAT